MYFVVHWMSVERNERKEKSIQDVYISLFVKIDRNELFPFRALSDPRQWLSSSSSISSSSSSSNNGNL